MGQLYKFTILVYVYVCLYFYLYIYTYIYLYHSMYLSCTKSGVYKKQAPYSQRSIEQENDLHTSYPPKTRNSAVCLVWFINMLLTILTRMFGISFCEKMVKIEKKFNIFFKKTLTFGKRLCLKIHSQTSKTFFFYIIPQTNILFVQHNTFFTSSVFFLIAQQLLF